MTPYEEVEKSIFSYEWKIIIQISFWEIDQIRKLILNMGESEPWKLSDLLTSIYKSVVETQILSTS